MSEAWVTLATNDQYAIGALVLAESLKRVGTTKQLHILITKQVTQPTRDILGKFYNAVTEVDVLDSRDEANLALIKRPELGVTFTKLYCWTLTQYTKAVFVDADALVLQNADELFGYPELSAAPDVGWPDCFNSGLFVFVPSRETYHALVQFGVSHGSFDGGDQGLLNSYFHDWNQKGPSHRLSFVYNMSSNVVYNYVAAYKHFAQKVKIVHFLGAVKPWHHHYDANTRRLSFRQDSHSHSEHVELWWRLFVETIVPLMNPETLLTACDTVWPKSQSPKKGVPEAAQGVSGLQQQVGGQDHQAEWERGNIEYLGRDAWDNIQKQLEKSTK